MHNPKAINIFTDGSMDRDTNQTGGTGFVIEFSELSDIPNIQAYFRRDNQGIHRLEMIAILEGIEALIKWAKDNSGEQDHLHGSRIIIHTDRHSLTDKELLNPWQISGWRRSGWKNHEGKPIKDKDLIDKIDKARNKLGLVMQGRIEIVYIRRKYNKRADKLSKDGKRSEARSRKILSEKNPKISKRMFDGEEIKYKELSVGDQLEIRIYNKDFVQKDCEVSAEISDGKHFGKKIKIYIDFMQELELHRHHYYKVVIKNVYRHHVRIRADFEEVVKEK